MRKRYKIWLIVIIILIVITSGIGISKIFFSKKEPEKKPHNTTSIISSIDKFGYTLDDRDTKYMQSEFKNLEDILASDPIDYQKYAESLAKLFVIDFYTLNNKVNKYDVGSLEYIYNAKKDDFNRKAQDTIYNDIIDNTYRDRVQELPEITNVEVLNVEETKITLNEQETDAYKVTMNYTYEKDLGYDTKGTVYFIKNNDRLELALYNPDVEATPTNEDSENIE